MSENTEPENPESTPAVEPASAVQPTVEMKPADDALVAAIKSGYRAKIVAVGVGALAIGLISGFIAVQATSGSSTTTASSPSPSPSASEDAAGGWSEQGAAVAAPLSDPSAPLPTGVNLGDSIGNATPYGWNYLPAKTDLPTITIWEDFQCPACKGFESSPATPFLLEQANAGKINLVYRPLAFLDMNLRNDASVRATAAWGCAIEAGAGEKYRELVYANQPAQEGVGFTDAQLLSGGKLVGLTGDALAKFESCFAAGTYSKWAGTSTALTPPEVGGTPTIMLDGNVLDQKQAWDVPFLEAQIKAATK